MDREQAIKILSTQTRLMDPPDGVWGLYNTTEDSWLATYHYPSGFRPFGDFYILPAVTADAVADLAKLGIAENDAPLALFSGLISEKLTGHRDNEDAIKYGFEKIKQEVADAVSQNYASFVANVAETKKLDTPIMKLDERTFRLWPDANLFKSALDKVRESFVNGTSMAAALAYIGDFMTPDHGAKKRLGQLARIHEANEFLARQAILNPEAISASAPQSYNAKIQSYSISQGIDMDAARKKLLQYAGASVAPVAAESATLSKIKGVRRDDGIIGRVRDHGATGKFARWRKIGILAAAGLAIVGAWKILSKAK